MWYEFLPKLLNMSITGGIIILIVLLMRLLLCRAPKVFSYALWAVVLFRLLCPASLSSSASVLNLFSSPSTASGRMEYIPEDIVHTESPAVALPAAGASEAVNNALPQGEEQLAADPLEAPVSILTAVWLAGAAALFLYSMVKLLRLKRRLIGAMPLRENIYLADHIGTPFVMGLLRPKIYLPSALSETEQGYILLHEQYHIRRLDHIVKALSFLALCLHWFNPLVWLAFVLSGKDMEMSCDEAVVRRLGTDVRADYSASLLSLSTGRRSIAGAPLAFGEGDVGSRIRNLLRWKRPRTWVLILAGAACAAIVVACAVNPAASAPPTAVPETPEELETPETPEEPKPEAQEPLTAEFVLGEERELQGVAFLFYGNHREIVRNPDAPDSGDFFLLSQPERQGEGGVWCVEQITFGNKEIGTRRPVRPAGDAAAYYARLQAQADAGAADWALDPMEVCLRTAQAIWLEASAEEFHAGEAYYAAPGSENAAMEQLLDALRANAEGTVYATLDLASHGGRTELAVPADDADFHALLAELTGQYDWMDTHWKHPLATDPWADESLDYFLTLRDADWSYALTVYAGGAFVEGRDGVWQVFPRAGSMGAAERVRAWFDQRAAANV